MKHRCYDLERIDTGDYTAAEYQDSLRKLNWVGILLGGDAASLAAFGSLPAAPRSILDVGCGGGQLTRKLARRYPDAPVAGIDVSAEAIAFARAANRPLPDNLSYEHQPGPDALPRANKSVDVVTATLVCHHMRDDALVSFLQEACRIARRAVIINDLHRHWLALRGFQLIAPVVFRNPLISQDGALSVRRAFKLGDWHALLAQAGIPETDYRIRWHFAFRWTLTIRCPTSPSSSSAAA